MMARMWRVWAMAQQLPNTSINSERGEQWIRKLVAEGRAIMPGELAVFGSKNQNSKKNFRHLHGDLNIDEIKNALRLLPVNRETNLMNLIRP